MGATKQISNAYDQGIAVYQNYLPQMTAKYNAVLTDLENKYNTETGKQNQTFGAERTTLTNSLAKRGLTASAGDQYFDTQHNALAGNQNVLSQDLLQKYASSRNDVLGQQVDATTDVMSKIAALQKDKQADLIDYKKWKKEYDRLKKQDKRAAKQWKKEFEQKKIDSAADRAYSYYSTNVSKNKDTSTPEESLIGDITAAVSGSGNYAPYLRELIYNRYKGKVSENTLQKYISQYMPNGWEDAAKKAAKTE